MNINMRIGIVFILLMLNSFILLGKSPVVGIFDVFSNKGDTNITKFDDGSYKFISYYQNGNQVRLEGVIENGMPLGVWRSYYINGTIHAQGLYTNSGFFFRKFYYPDGTLDIADSGYIEKKNGAYEHVIRSSTEYDFCENALDKAIFQNNKSTEWVTDQSTNRPKFKQVRSITGTEIISYSLVKSNGVIDVIIYVISSKNDYYKFFFTGHLSSEKKIIIDQIFTENIPNTWNITIKSTPSNEALILIVSGIMAEKEPIDIVIERKF